MENNQVVAILVTYNPDLDKFQDVLRSICNQVTKVILIDNASINKDELYKLIKKNFTDQVDYISSSSNIGLSGAQNIGLRKAHELKAQQIILFDQDSRIDNNFIDSLINAQNELLSNGILVGAIGPVFLDSDSLKPYPATIYKGPFINRKKINKVIEATFIIASGCLIRMSVIDKVGEMKEELFIDYVDVEWSLRARSLGYKIFISPKARMIHSIGDRRMMIMGRSISVHSPIRRYFLTRNSFYMMRLNYVPLGYKLREGIFNLLRMLISVASSEQKLTYLRYGLLGIRDGWKGKFGPLKQD